MTTGTAEINSGITGRRLPTAAWVAWGVLILALNTTILFYVIPKMHDNVHQLYNQDEYADGYDQLAANLVSGNGYRFYPDTAKTLMREPGYPVFLAGIFYVFGNSLAAVKAVNLCLAFITAYLSGPIVRSVSDEPLLILGAPILFLFHPGTLIAESRGGSEALFTVLLTLFALTLYRAFRRDTMRDYLLSGAVLGLAVLVRSTPLLFPVVLFGYLFFYERQRRLTVRDLVHVGAMVVMMVAVLSPWIIRNYSLTGKFVPTASVVGVSAQTGLYISTHYATDSHRVDREAAQERNGLAEGLGLPFKSGYYQYFYASADELKFSDFLLKRVMSEYKSHPTLFLRIASMNLFNFWCGGKASGSIIINVILQLPYVTFALLGVIWTVRGARFRAIAPLVLLITYIMAVSVPILAQARYSVPIIPFVSVLAGVGVLGLRARVRAKAGV